MKNGWKGYIVPFLNSIHGKEKEKQTSANQKSTIHIVVVLHPKDPRSNCPKADEARKKELDNQI